MSAFSLDLPLRFLQAGASPGSSERGVKPARSRDLLAVASMDEAEVLAHLDSSLEGLNAAEAALRDQAKVAGGVRGALYFSCSIFAGEPRERKEPKMNAQQQILARACCLPFGRFPRARRRMGGVTPAES
jgi:hypothetical protein